VISTLIVLGVLLSRRSGSGRGGRYAGGGVSAARGPATMVPAAMAAATAALVAMEAVSEAMVAEEGVAVGRGGSSPSHACGLKITGDRSIGNSEYRE
jgi:hypothetical protein